jgi:dTDP-4-dehydrorhamnose 3,5-epimerase
MNIIKTKLDGVLIIEPDVFADNRGFFFESYNLNRYRDAGIDTNFVQDNISKSAKGTVRGIHYQAGDTAQGKLCQVISGNVLDVAVDIRYGSPTYGQHVSVNLSAEKHNQIWLPPGFGHGFSVLSDEVIFMYKCTDFYSKKDERAILYCDTDLNIDWQVEIPIVSDRDKAAKKFKDIDRDFIY